jgi:hypothetical protein
MSAAIRDVAEGFREFVFPMFVCLFVSMGVRGKPRIYYSLLTYFNARFGLSNFGHQMPRAYRPVPHSSGGSWNLWEGKRTGNLA